MQISESELEVMKILWEKDKLTSAEIVEILSKNSTWKPKTIQTLITRLVSKGAIKVDKTNKKSYIYSFNVSEDEYKKEANKSFLEKLYNGSINMMLTSFVKDKKITKKDLEELEKILDDNN